jgi:hypothetical protein
MKHFLTLALIGTLFLSACTKEDSKDVNQDKVYSEYELIYNKNTDKTTAVARFKFGGATGTLLELSSPAQVTFNGDVLAYSALWGAHIKEYAGVVSTGTFVYTDNNSATYTNAVGAPVAIAFSAIDTISNTAAYTFSWTGDTISAGETVVLTIDGAAQSNLEVFSTSLVGATSMVLAQNKLVNLGNGDAMAYLEHWKLNTLQQGTPEGGTITVKYKAADKKIYVKN